MAIFLSFSPWVIGYKSSTVTNFHLIQRWILQLTEFVLSHLWGKGECILLVQGVIILRKV